MSLNLPLRSSDSTLPLTPLHKIINFNTVNLYVFSRDIFGHYSLSWKYPLRYNNTPKDSEKEGHLGSHFQY